MTMNKAEKNFQKACLLWDKKNEKEAFNLFLKAAKNNHSSAQNNVGIFFEFGFGVKKDISNALYWYKKAVKEGEYTAYNNMASLYASMGEFSNAIKYYQKAIDKDDGDSMLELGELYIKLKKIPQAIQCFESALKSENITQESKEKAKHLIQITYE